jgi:hypothetical protein
VSREGAPRAEQRSASRGPDLVGPAVHRVQGTGAGRSVENLEEVASSDCVEEASRKHAVLEESVARYFGSLGPVAACRDLRVRGSQIPAAKKELDGQEK